ncbi:RNA polymerase sigma factor [Nocardia fluminea]|uniref:RNA polymerase sigma factor n=1 Tax=Nocardia fluminea TaxID=134984 RepID=UPI003D14F23E
MSDQRSNPPRDPQRAVLEEELDEFFLEHFAPLVGYLRGGERVPEHVAEAAAHYAFQVVRRKWPDLREDRPKAFLYRVAIWWARKHLGKQEAVPSGLAVKELGDGRSSEAIDELLAGMRVDALLDELPRRQRQVVFLVDLHGFRGPDTAQILDVSEGTVKKTLFMARARLRDLIEKEADQ